MAKTTTTTTYALPPWVNTGVQNLWNAYTYGTSGILNRYGNPYGQGAPYQPNNAYTPGGFGGGFAPPGPPGTGGPPQTFIAPFSDDTTKAHGMARAFAAGTTPRDIRNLVTGDLNNAITGAIAGMGGLGQRPAPTFAPFQALSGDEVAAQSLAGARVGDVGNIAARQGADLMSAYLNPYLRDVVDTSLADYDVGVDRQAAQSRARRDAAAAFGDRAAVADAVFAADSNRGRGALAAGLRSQAFNTAAGFGMQDTDRFFEADRTNQNVAVQRAMENARLQQAAAEANARLAQDAAFKNTDIRNSFKLGNDERLRALEMQNFNAGLANDRFRLDALNTQAGTAQNQQRNTADLYGAADAAELRRIQAQGAVGEAVDEHNQRYNDEYLNTILFGSQLLNQLPYETTTTQISKTKKGFLDKLGALAQIAGSLGLQPFTNVKFPK
jgi:hypothetical protein